MRILAVATLYPLTVEDYAGQFNHITFRALWRQGHEVEVYRCHLRLPYLLSRDWHRQGRPRVPASYALQGVPVSCPRFWRPPGVWWRAYEGAWRYRAMARRARQRHAERPFDLVYGCELVPDGAAAALLAQNLGLPLIVSSIGSDAWEYPYQLQATMKTTQWVVRQADLILVESRRAAEAVQALVPEPLRIEDFNRGIDLDPFRTLPNQADLRKQAGLPSGRRLIVFVGMLIEGKGIRILGDAFQRIQARFADTDLVIIGAGSLGSWLAERATAGSWRDRLHLLGRRPFNRIPALISACDIFCLPSFGEGLPKSMIEAMAAGLPVVATSVGGIPDALRDGSSGLLIPPRDAPALESALTTLLSAPEEAENFGRAGRTIAFEHFDADRNCQRLLDLAASVLPPAPRAAFPTGPVPDAIHQQK